MKVMVIDDDRDYCYLITDFLKKGGIFLVCITNELDLRRVDLDQYDAILVDHSLGWTKGSELIDILSTKTNASFALISTYAPSLFSVNNVVNPRINEIFGKYQLDKVYEFLDYVSQKKLILGHDTNQSKSTRKAKRGTQKAKI